MNNVATRLQILERTLVMRQCTPCVLSVWGAGRVMVGSSPLFNAGRLEAIEEQALARVQVAEQQYLELVYRA